MSQDQERDTSRDGKKGNIGNNNGSGTQSAPASGSTGPSAKNAGDSSSANVGQITAIPGTNVANSEGSPSATLDNSDAAAEGSPNANFGQTLVTQENKDPVSIYVGSPSTKDGHEEPGLSDVKLEGSPIVNVAKLASTLATNLGKTPTAISEVCVI